MRNWEIAEIENTAAALSAIAARISKSTGLSLSAAALVVQAAVQIVFGKRQH